LLFISYVQAGAGVPAILGRVPSAMGYQPRKWERWKKE